MNNITEKIRKELISSSDEKCNNAANLAEICNGKNAFLN